MNRFVLSVAVFCVSFSALGQDLPRKPREDSDVHQRERQQWFYGQRQYPSGRIPAGARIDAITAIKARERAMRQPGAAPRALNSSTWTLIGPQPTNGGTGYLTAGRINAVAIDPRNNNSVYIGAAEGGVWKTTDGGSSWVSLTDDQASLANGAIALDPSNPDTVYVGTGEENFAGDSYYGAGILKSTDAGQTWTNLVGPFLQATIGSLAVHPTNGSILLCASDTGVWRSADAANTWTQVITGTGNIVMFDPTNGNTAYASMGNPNGDKTHNGVYQSSDGGLTWARTTGSGTSSFPTTNVGRIALAMAPSNTTTLYASISNSSASLSGELLGIWKTTDGGATWNQLPISATLAATWGPQMWYDNALVVSPVDPGIVIAGGVGLFRTMDGGSTWAQLPYIGANNTEIHVDQHFLAFTPDGTELFVANDGGIYSSTTITGAASAVNWTVHNQTLAITQFYPGMTLDPANPSFALAGAQDNGTQAYVGQLSWDLTTCGDGGFTIIDPTFPSLAYAACEYIALEQSTGKNPWVPADYGIDQTDRVQFIAPFVADLANPQSLYFGTYRVWRSTDAGGKWAAISPDLTNGRGTITTLAVAPGDSNTIYVGTSNSRIETTRNALNAAGPTWTNATHGLPPRTLTQIAPDAVDPTVAYAAFSGFSGITDNQGHIFRTTDAGSSWTDISGNLPNVPVDGIVPDPDIAGTLYAATDAGVMVSADGGNTWNTLGSGLPIVVVESLVLHRSARVLLAATHGRSVWEIPVPLPGASLWPTIASISPNNANAGSADVALSVSGANFGSSALVRWNGQDLASTVVNSSTIQATIPAANIAAVGRASISVFDPVGGPSNAVNFAIGPAPVSSSAAAVSAANPLGGSTLGQRAISSLYGANLASQTASADGGPPLPFTLGGTTLTIGSNSVPLFFVSPGQLNFQVPFLSVTKATQEPLVITQGTLITTINVTLAPYAPALFTTNSQGSGQASAVINGTASLPAPSGAFPGSRPVNPGEFVALYATGLGDVNVRPLLGSASPSNPPSTTLTKPTVTLAGEALDPSLVVFSGLAPGFVGLYQVNFQIPATAPSGDAIPLSLTIGGITSNTATIAIQ